jgi:hypothetical protein
VSAKRASGGSSKGAEAKPQVAYGTDWYTQTREAARPKRTVREEIGESSSGNPLPPPPAIRRLAAPHPSHPSRRVPRPRAALGA